MATLGWSMGGLIASALVLAAASGNKLDDAMPAGSRVAAASFDGPVSASVVRVIDGDTFEAQAQIWIGEAIDIRVRIRGIDAPELHARCDEERARAQAARDFLERRIGGSFVKLSNVRYDKYGGRVDADVRDSRGDVGDALIRAHLARAYLLRDRHHRRPSPAPSRCLSR